MAGRSRCGRASEPRPDLLGEDLAGQYQLVHAAADGWLVSNVVNGMVTNDLVQRPEYAVQGVNRQLYVGGHRLLDVLLGASLAHWVPPFSPPTLSQVDLIQKMRGRPATGQNPVVMVRLTPELIAAVDA